MAGPRRLRQQRLRPHAERLESQRRLVEGVRGDHHDRSRDVLHDPARRLVPVQPRHVDVHQHYVRPQALREASGLLAVAGGANDVDVRVLTEHLDQQLPCDRGIFCDDDAGHVALDSDRDRSLETISSRLDWSKLDLTMYASAPTSTPRALDSCESSPVTSTTGSSASSRSPRMRSVSVKPSRPGMSISKTARSKLPDRSVCNASKPSTASSTR